jgi:hypothetical protein
MLDMLGTILGSGLSNPETWLLPMVVMAFVFAIPITAIITEHFQKRERMRVIGKALEQGVPVENLGLNAAEDKCCRRMPYRSGMVTMAVGLGVLVIGLLGFGDHLEDMTGVLGGGSNLFVGGGALLIFIGLALLINDRMNYKRFFEDERGR